MKKILVPTDFSDYAQAATAVAIDLARKSDAEIYFLHLEPTVAQVVHEQAHGSTNELPETKQRLAFTKDALRKEVENAERAGVKATPVLVFDNGTERIESYIEPYQIDLVVMGSHGIHSFKDAVIGSNTQYFVRHSSAPVLVIKKKPEKFEIKNIAFASDFHKDFIKPFEIVKTLASLWNANLDLLYVNTPYHFRETREVLSDIKRFMHQFQNLKYTAHIYNALDEEKGIREFIHERASDLIAITTYGRTGFMRVLTHSIAQSLVKDEDVPVLVMNIKMMIA